MFTPATPEGNATDPRGVGPVSTSYHEPSQTFNGPPDARQASPTESPQPVTITVNGEESLTVGRQGASRESQISLPEEAKRYYAAIASPAVSPGMKFNFPQSAQANPNSPLKPQDEDGSQSHAGMNGMGTNGHGVGLGIPNDATLTPEGRGRTNGRVPGSDRAGSVTTEEGAEFLDLEDEDSAYETSVNGAGQHGAYEEPPRQSDEFRRRDKHTRPPPPAVEDFPLPPATSIASPPPQPQYAREGPPPAVQVQMGTPSRQGSLADNGREGRPSMSTSDSHTYQAPSLASSQTMINDQPPPSPFPLPIPANPPQMKFRALPLLAEDLPYTEVVVSNSTIRPNDRGKEVLSFIISIDPGRGKERWKVEKLYSDVLSLDTRVRAAVGRTASKKLATLPEGRLWRDHAPAKVDQRKVRRYFYLT